MEELNIMTNELKKRVSVDKNDISVKDIVWLLYDTTLLHSGFNLDEPGIFCNRINRMIIMGLSLDDNQEVENNNEEQTEPQEEIEEQVDDETENKMEELD